MRTQTVRRANAAAAVAWAAMVPISIVTDWIYSIAFIAACSIYANFVSHLSAQRADVPDPEILGCLHEIIDYLEDIEEAMTK